MSMRAHVEELLASLFDFGKILSTRVTATKKSVTAKIQGDTNADTTAEAIDDQELWGIAGLNSRPKAPTAAGGAEVLFWRRGDELVGLSWRDLRWQVDISEGEVVLFGLGLDGARQAVIRCKPNGTVKLEGVVVEIDGTNVKVGDAAGATQAIALGTALQTYLNANKVWQDTHVHAETGGTTLVPTVLSGAVPTVASTKHNVEP